MTQADVQTALVALQLALLAVAFVFAVIAVRGYRGTPWGRVLRPMPAVLALMAMGAFVSLLPATPPHGGIYTTSLLAVALLGIVYATIELIRVLRRGTGVSR